MVRIGESGRTPVLAHQIQEPLVLWLVHHGCHTALGSEGDGEGCRALCFLEVLNQLLILEIKYIGRVEQWQGVTSIYR